MGYNTAMLGEKERPRDWPDLLAPFWKGKFAMDEEEFEWFGTLVDYWGREKAGKFIRALAAQQPQLRRGHSLLAQLLAAGEFPAAIVFPFEIEQLKQKGARVDWAATSDPIVTSINVMALSTKAPHANAGKLLINYVLVRRRPDHHQESLPRADPPRRQADHRQARSIGAENPLRPRRHVPQGRRVRKGIQGTVLEKVVKRMIARP